MSRPIFFGVLKSKGVLFTFLISPVGIRLESTGRKLSALITNSCPNISFWKLPERLKYECCVKFIMVVLSVSAKYSTINSSLLFNV